ARGVLLGQHGLINWADDHHSCYLTTLELIERAARFVEARYEANGGGGTPFGGALPPSPPPAARRDGPAPLLPRLPRQVSRQKRLIATVQDDDAILRFVNSHDAPRLAELGTSCPDHFLRTKIKPLYVPLDPGELAGGAEALVLILKEKLAVGLERYRADY